MNLAHVLDLAQLRLHDAQTIGEDGTIWTRQELLDWAEDGYRRLLGQTKAAKRFTVLDVPGRFSVAITHPWEALYALESGNFWQWTFNIAPGWAGTSLWEAEELGYVTPTAAANAVTQPWELAYMASQHTPFRFGVARNQERIDKIWYDHRPLHALTVRELDEQYTQWISLAGEPIVWTLGTGRNRTIEIFEVLTGYTQAYLLKGEGQPRYWSGARTYTTRHEPRGTWDYGYTTPGDADAITRPGESRLVALSTCFAWERAYAQDPQAVATFTVDYTDQYPDLGVVCTQPWEYHYMGGPYLDGENRGGTRGTFPWERQSPEQSYQASTPFFPGALEWPGTGLKLTLEEVDGFSPLFQWEHDFLSGETTLTDSPMVGTAPWESEYEATDVSLPFGVLRGVVSPDRQYIPVLYDSRRDPIGMIRRVATSNDNLLLLESPGPDVHALSEEDELGLLPEQLFKVLRDYVLYRAFDRQGEGYDGTMAALYLLRFERGARVLRTLGNLSRRDRQYQRGQVSPPGRRPERVRLPSHYPRVRF